MAGTGTSRLATVVAVGLSVVVLGPVRAGDLPEEPPEERRQAPEIDLSVGDDRPRYPFALYVEASAGLTEVDSIATSIQTSVTRNSSGFLDVDESEFGRAAVGWRLPEDRGSFLVRFEGHKETSYEFNTVGNDARAVTPTGTAILATAPVPWYRVNASNGSFRSERRPPLWDPDTEDTVDPNGEPDAAEITRFGPSELNVSRAAPQNLQNRLQFVDFIFQRDFGGRTISGRWTSGLRYSVYEGNVPAGMWLSVTESERLGFTDGGFQRLISFNQDATGVGPTGSLELQLHYFRDRLVLFGQGKFAFIIQSVETNSSAFTVLVSSGVSEDPDPQPVTPFEATLNADRDKSAWQLTAELGVRVRLVEGLRLHLSYVKNSFQDVVLMPTRVFLETDGVSANYKTQDYELDGWIAGVGFQF